MHRFLVRLHAKLIPFSLQVRTFSSSFPEHERKAEKVLKSGNFRGIGSCVLLLVPGSPSSHHSTSLNLNCQLFQLNWSRLLHIPNGLQQDDKHPNPTIVGKEQNKIPTGNSSEPESTTKASDRRRKDERRKMDFTKIYTERNFITPLRAMNDYLLKPSDLEGIRKVQRRSPFEHNPPITVYLRRDIEMKALEVWGSQEALQRELKKKLEEDKKYRDSVFNVKKVLKEYSRSTMHEEERTRHEMILQTSGRVVITAVIINATNFALKLVAWIYTGSHSMFAEAIHSLADTGNQLLLAYGIKKSIQTPTQDHPYGYHNMRYVASLISGVGIFFFGTGLSLYHGIMGVINPGIMESVLWAYVILGGSLISEGGTLMVAYREVKRGAKREGMTIKDYVLRGQDPSVNVVLLEDIAAVLGIGIAGTCVGLTSYTGLPIYDAVGSILVGGVLGAVASFIIYTNTAALVGRSIRTERLIEMNKDMENDVMVRAIHDVKATDMGNNFVRYKAEVDFDGRELTRSYLESYDLEILLEDMQKLKTIEDVEAFMLKHGENIVDLLGGQVDRIETNLKKRHPEVRHVDLEVL